MKNIVRWLCSLLLVLVSVSTSTSAQVQIKNIEGAARFDQQHRERQPSTNDVHRPLVNHDVEEMLSMGLAEDIIVDKIRGATATNFDTSVAAVKKLKALNASDGVIRAVLHPTPPAATPPKPKAQVTAAGAPASADPVSAQPNNAQRKPIVLIAGTGNLTINSNAQAVGDWNWAVASKRTTVSKHDQTMEMAKDFLAFCPEVESTLDSTSRPDYFVALNREAVGTSFNIGQSQVMVLNANKAVIFVTKKGTVANAVKSACNAIAADRQANGLGARDSIPPQAAETSATAAHPASSSVAQKATVALVLQTTAAAQKRCKPETISTVLNDTRTYLTSKGVAIGPAPTSRYVLMLTVDRPLSKWIEITIQARDENNNVLWSDKLSDGGWGHVKGAATLNVLDKIHQIIDAKFGEHNGLPLSEVP